VAVARSPLEDFAERRKETDGMKYARRVSMLEQQQRKPNQAQVTCTILEMRAK
jgi:hypothetical protein